MLTSWMFICKWFTILVQSTTVGTFLDCSEIVNVLEISFDNSIPWSKSSCVCWTLSSYRNASGSKVLIWALSIFGRATHVYMVGITEHSFTAKTWMNENWLSSIVVLITRTHICTTKIYIYHNNHLCYFLNLLNRSMTAQCFLTLKVEPNFSKVQKHLLVKTRIPAIIGTVISAGVHRLISMKHFWRQM